MSDNRIKPSETAVLSICICGQHNNGYLPISQLQGTNVLLHYVDKNGDIKAWDGDVQKQIEDAIEKTNKRWREKLLIGIGQLRQYLNERTTNGLITSEEIKVWFSDLLEDK